MDIKGLVFWTRQLRRINFSRKGGRFLSIHSTYQVHMKLSILAPWNSGRWESITDPPTWNVWETGSFLKVRDLQEKFRRRGEMTRSSLKHVFHTTLISSLRVTGEIWKNWHKTKRMHKLHGSEQKPQEEHSKWKTWYVQGHTLFYLFA